MVICRNSGKDQGDIWTHVPEAHDDVDLLRMMLSLNNGRHATITVLGETLDIMIEAPEIL
eukprot:4432386-Prorocentrum_lima.AAC.1